MRYDYENQAWIGDDGRYISCAHHHSMNCECYGRIHAGQLATPPSPDEVVRAADDATIYNQGWRARATGMAATACPYEERALARVWHMGFLDQAPNRTVWAQILDEVAQKEGIQH